MLGPTTSATGPKKKKKQLPDDAIDSPFFPLLHRKVLTIGSLQIEFSSLCTEAPHMTVQAIQKGRTPASTPVFPRDQQDSVYNPFLVTQKCKGSVDSRKKRPLQKHSATAGEAQLTCMSVHRARQGGSHSEQSRLEAVK